MIRARRIKLNEYRGRTNRKGVNRRAVENMDYNELRATASALKVFKVGMKKGQLINAILEA